MAEPPVSVMIPTYNRVELVQQAIDSVLDQTFEAFELIVVDDASTDATPDVVPEIDDERLTYVRHERNRHGAAARNTGIERASGQYVAFLDDDDEWYPEKLARQVQRFEECDDRVGLVYCWADVYDGDRKVNERCPELSGDIFDETVVRNPIGNTSTFMLQASVLDDVGGFDESLERGQDSDLVRRIAYQYACEYVSEVLVKHRWRHAGEQITDTNPDNIYASIASRKATLRKFDQYFEQNQSAKAHVYAAISRLYGTVGDWRHCFKYALRSIRAAPHSRDVRRELERLIKEKTPDL